MKSHWNMNTEQTVALIICLLCYAASGAYIFIMDTWAITAHGYNWAKLSYIDRVWILSPMLLFQIFGLTSLIGTHLQYHNRYLPEELSSSYTGNKFDWY